MSWSTCNVDRCGFSACADYSSARKGTSAGALPGRRLICHPPVGQRRTGATCTSIKSGAGACCRGSLAIIICCCQYRPVCRNGRDLSGRDIIIRSISIYYGRSIRNRFVSSGYWIVSSSIRLCSNGCVCTRLGLNDGPWSWTCCDRFGFGRADCCSVGWDIFRIHCRCWVSISGRTSRISRKCSFDSRENIPRIAFYSSRNQIELEVLSSIQFVYLTSSATIVLL